MSDIFGRDALQAAIDAELGAIPDGKRTALVGYYTIQGSWRVTAIHRVGEHWEFAGTIGQDRDSGRMSGGVKVIATW